MAWNTPGTVVAGQVLTAARWNSDVVANTSFLFSPPMVFCRQSSGQTINSNTSTALQWNGTDLFDTDSMHDPSTNNTRITINTAGIYAVHFNWSSVATPDNGVNNPQIRLNGSTTPIFSTFYQSIQTASFTISGVYKFAATNYIEAFIRFTHSTTLTSDHDGDTNKAPTSFSAVWIGND